MDNTAMISAGKKGAVSMMTELQSYLTLVYMDNTAVFSVGK